MQINECYFVLNDKNKPIKYIVSVLMLFNYRLGEIVERRQIVILTDNVLGRKDTLGPCGLKARLNLQGNRIESSTKQSKC